MVEILFDPPKANGAKSLCSIQGAVEKLKQDGAELVQAQSQLC